MILGARPRSLVSILFTRVVFLLAATIAVIGAVAFWAAKNRIDRVYDSELITGTKILYTLTKEELEEANENHLAGLPPPRKR